METRISEGKKKTEKLGDSGLKDHSLHASAGHHGRAAKTSAIKRSDQKDATGASESDDKNKDALLAQHGGLETQNEPPAHQSSGINALKAWNNPQFRRQDFVVRMMEEGAFKSIFSLITQVAAMYFRGVPADKVMDELAKKLSEELGESAELRVKITEVEQELKSRLAYLAQLQKENDDLKKLEEQQTQKGNTANPESSDSKHATDDKQKKLKAAQPKIGTARKK